MQYDSGGTLIAADAPYCGSVSSLRDTAAEMIVSLLGAHRRHPASLSVPFPTGTANSDRRFLDERAGATGPLAAGRLASAPVVVRSVGPSPQAAMMAQVLRSSWASVGRRGGEEGKPGRLAGLCLRGLGGRPPAARHASRSPLDPCKLRPEHLELALQLSRVHGKLDAVVLSLGELKPQLGVFGRQLEQR